jgi:hypothetical protein
VRRGRGVRLQLGVDEVDVLRHLADELGALLTPDDAQPDADTADADALAGMSWPGSEPVPSPGDPAVLRLLPDAYRDDPQAAAEFRRFTDATLREGMDADLVVVRTDLNEIAERGRLTLTEDAVAAWLRVLNRLRLVLATRLGIETAADHEALAMLGPADPRAAAFLLFEWVGYLLGNLLTKLG